MLPEDEEDLTAVGTRAELSALAQKKTGGPRPWLVILTGSGSVGKMFRLEHQLAIGRSPVCQVQVDEDGVSRRHARLELTPEGNVQIVDLDSKNGTFVNGAAVSRETLRDGDKIQVGVGTVLKFSYQDELDEGMQRNLYELATRDALTRALNKRAFVESLAKEFGFARRHGRPLSIVSFDVDHFKRINDTYGHGAGDEVLARLGEIVAASIRTEDVFARVGGEEFAVLLRDIGLDGAFECADRIRRSVEKTSVRTEGGAVIQMTISSGVATQSAQHGAPEALVESADKGLYEAKRAGRNRVCRGPVAAAPRPATD